MSEPFIGEIRIFSFDWAPRNWAKCDGQTLTISQNQALASLLGTTYGGNGTTTFSLPNLRGRTPVHVGGGISQGQMGGEAQHTLIVAELPAHAHVAKGSTATGNTPAPASAVLATLPSGVYAPAASSTALVAGTVSNSGGTQAHANMQPYLVLNFCIALFGSFPSRP